MSFPTERFNKFAAQLLIDSKERGQIRLTQKNQLTTQKFLMQEIAKGWDEGVHFFVTLKGRQEGITTICGALDLFWHYEYPGMQGTFAAHDDDAKEKFRKILSMYHEGLPREYRRKMTQNNRTILAWGNRSVLQLQIGGGARGKGKKGRGSGFNFIHATECSSWEDQESLASILASLSQKNDKRLHLFESTARGFNLFKDMWDNAKNAVTQRAIFVGWWLNELYRKEKGSPEYETYWDGAFTSSEMDWVRAIKLLYGHDITPEQMAWWRWMSAEIIHDDDMLMQEYPATERHAFILSGSHFFSIPLIEREEQRIDQERAPSYWRYKFGETFMHTAVEEVNEQIAQLLIWELPDPLGYYSIGGDPAFGSSEWADQFCLSSDTELLTDKGWVTYDQIKVGDRAACFDLKKEEYDFYPVERVIVKDHDGPMVHFKTRSFDCLSTPEHRVVAKISQNRKPRKLYPWEFRRADDLPRHFRVPLGGAPSGRGVPELSHSMCRIIGWLATDGHHTVRPPNTGRRKKKWNGAIILVQSLETRKCDSVVAEVMRQVLYDEFGISPKFKPENTKNGKNNGAQYVWYIPASITKRIMSWFDGDIHRISRRLITGCSDMQLWWLYTGLMEGDGTANKKGIWYRFYPGYSHGLADDLQEIAIRLGFSASKATVPSNGQVVVNVAYRKWHYVRKRETFDYRGKVWCVTVPTGAFVARRNGTVFVTGNCISIWRCYADRFEQVAEFCTPHLTTFRYAWVLCSLAGLYRQSRINLEINGPGEAVMNEINTLRRQANSIPTRSDGKELRDVLGAMKYYLYRRLDSPSGGTGVYHTLTTHKMKERMLGGYNDLIEKGEAIIHGKDLLEEMKIFIRDEGTLGAPDRAKDDRVIAASLAAVQYIEHMRIPLEQMGVTWEKERLRRAKREETGEDVGGDNQVSRAVRSYMGRVGLRMP